MNSCFKGQLDVILLIVPLRYGGFGMTDADFVHPVAGLSFGGLRWIAIVSGKHFYRSVWVGNIHLIYRDP